MKFLILAEKYAEEQGDENWFKYLYTEFRENNGVEESIRKAITHLYGYDVANLLELLVLTNE